MPAYSECELPCHEKAYKRLLYLLYADISDLRRAIRFTLCHSYTLLLEA